MTDKEIVEKAKKAEKKTGFGKLVHSPISKGVNSAFGIGFIEGMVEYRNSMQEKPVSEDLEEAIGEYCSNPENFITYIDVGFKQSPIKKDDIPLIIKAIEFGARWQKEQMMKDALDAVVKIDAGGYPYVDTTIELYDYVMDMPLAKEGDKYKVIVIKEE